MRRATHWTLVAATTATIAASVDLRSSSLTQAPRFEFRIVVAQKGSLLRQLDEAGRDGFRCLTVAQNEPGASVPAVVAILARQVGGPGGPAEHRVVTGLGGSGDAMLDRAGADGFRLCGAVLDEEPPAPIGVAIMSRSAGAAPETWQYRTEVLSNYKNSLARLNAAAQDGFVPVAAAATNSSRVPDMRTWMVIVERAAGGAVARDIVTRSAPGPSGLQKALNEQGKQGYRIDVLWREGNSYVAMMSHPTSGPIVPHTYSAEDDTRSRIRWVRGPLLADFPYLDRRLLVADASVSASNEVVEEPIPAPGPIGYVDARTLTIVGDHLSRNRGYVPGFATVSPGPKGTWLLATVVTQKN
jgi:hypothetical protein